MAKPQSNSNAPFQSTLPVRGATAKRYDAVWVRLISIHAPREGSDLIALWDCVYKIISIHAPREGSDRCGKGLRFGDGDFNPRSP